MILTIKIGKTDAKGGNIESKVAEVKSRFEMAFLNSLN